MAGVGWARLGWVGLGLAGLGGVGVVAGPVRALCEGREGWQGRGEGRGGRGARSREVAGGRAWRRRDASERASGCCFLVRPGRRLKTVRTLGGVRGQVLSGKRKIGSGGVFPAGRAGRAKTRRGHSRLQAPTGEPSKKSVQRCALAPPCVFVWSQGRRGLGRQSSYW